MAFVRRIHVKLHEDFYTEIVLSTGLSLGIAMETFRAFATFQLKRRSMLTPGGSGIPSKSCTGVSYSVQGWSIVSVHTENVSTTKFSNSR